METLDDDWELSPENAHPRAAELMRDPYFWDIGDDNSPFGNDAGADTLDFYRAWYEENDEAGGGEFLSELFEEWDVDQDFATSIPDSELGSRLEDENYHIFTYDDSVVALAFAQLILTGEVEPQIGQAAIVALRRQALPEVIEYRGWSDPTERELRCVEMTEALLKAE